MRRTRPPYPPEFRRQIVELARAGRSVQELGAIVLLRGIAFPRLLQVLPLVAAALFAVYAELFRLHAEWPHEAAQGAWRRDTPPSDRSAASERADVGRQRATLQENFFIAGSAALQEPLAADRLKRRRTTPGSGLERSGTRHSLRTPG